MRHYVFSAVVLSFLLAPYLAGQEMVAQRIDPPAGAPATVGEFMARLRAIPHRESVPRSHVITFDTHDSAFLIPIAGNLQGAGGTFFRSDLFVGNYSSTEQRIGVAWLQASVPNSGNPTYFFTLPGNSAVSFFDFVGQTLGKSGLGAIVVSAVDSQGNPTSDGSIDGFSRIWTPQPGSTGTVSQNFEAISVTDSLGSLDASILGLRQNAAFRTNVGIVNLDTVSHTWSVAGATGATQLITVPAYSVVQTGLTSGFGSSTSGSVALTLRSDGAGFWWSAYGTSNDNVTGDGWVARAKQ